MKQFFDFTEASALFQDQVSSSAKKLEPNLNFENPPATVEEQWKEQVI